MASTKSGASRCGWSSLARARPSRPRRWPLLAACTWRVPGRLPDLIKRFDTLTLPLWKKHGIQQAGFWTVAIGPSNQDLYYMLKWESLDDRAKRFAGFQADPEWISGRAETEKNGPLVMTFSNQFLKPTSFSSVK